MVLGGGGLRGPFMAGVLSAFLESGIDYRFFDFYLASSSGAYCVAYFLTGRVDSHGLPAWRLLANQLIRFRYGAPFMDFKYVDWIVRDAEPFSTKIIRERNVPAYITISNIETGKPEYVNISTADDPITLLKASCAMPLLSPPVLLGGRLYYDGTLTDPIPIHKAEAEGAKEIWLILAVPRGFCHSTILWKQVFKRSSQDPLVRQMIAQGVDVNNKALEKIEARDDLIVFRPDKKLPASLFRASRKSVDACFEIGRNIGFRVLKEKKLI